MLTAAALLLLAPIFEDATEPAGLAEVKADRFSFADIDGDGDPDLVAGGRRLFINHAGRFEERKGALARARGGSASCVDMDGDGRLDVVTLGGDLFLQKKDGSFERSDLGFPERQASFGIGDVDGDGKPDILTGGGELWKDERSHKFPRKLFLNRGKGRFEDATERYGIGAAQYGRSVVFCDFDDDGDVDLYIGNYRLDPNEFWANDGKRLTEEAEARGCRGVGRRIENSEAYFGHTIGASWADLDADGWMDLWVSNLVHKYVGPWRGEQDDRGEICDDSNLLRNRGPPAFDFEDRRGESGIPLMPKGPRGVYRGDELWSNCACADYDNDGNLDVFVMQVYQLNYSFAHLYRGRGGFEFEDVDWGCKVYNGYGAAWADVDGDGRMDLITGGSPGAPKGPRQVRLWRNVTEGGGWIGFRFKTPVLGATVRVITKTRVHTRMVEAGMGSHAQQNSDILHVGLGTETPEEVRVTWPDGTMKLVKRPRTGRTNVIEHKPWRKPPKIRLERKGKKLACRPAQRSVRYHWDLDGDFRTDAVTREAVIDAPEDATKACVRVFKGTKGIKARLK